MCVICLLWEKGKITKREAERAASEVIETGTTEQVEHMWEVVNKIEGTGNCSVCGKRSTTYVCSEDCYLDQA